MGYEKKKNWQQRRKSPKRVLESRIPNEEIRNTTKEKDIIVEKINVKWFGHPVSYTHLDVYKRQNYPFPLTILHKKQKVLRTLQSELYAKNYLILFEFVAVSFAIEIHLVKHKTEVNYPFPLTDLHQKR